MWSVKFLSKLTSFNNNMRDDTVLNLGAGARYCSLVLGGPRNETFVIVDAVSRGRAMRVRVTNPISVRVVR
jgi:hypothetical protein